MPFPPVGSGAVEAHQMLQVFGLPRPSEHAYQQPTLSSEVKQIGPFGVLGVAIDLCLYWEWVHLAVLRGLGSEEPSSLNFEVTGQFPGLNPNAEGPPVSPQRTPSVAGTTCLGTALWITVSQEFSTCC